MMRNESHLNELEDKVSTLERANFDLKMQLYYLNKKLSEQKSQHNIDENQEILINMIEDNSIDVLTLKVENEAAKRRITELESELLQLQLMRERETEVTNNRYNYSGTPNRPTNTALVDENRKREKEASRAIAEHDSALIQKLRAEIDLLHNRHAKDIQLIDEMAQKVSDQMEATGQKQMEVNICNEKLREQFQTVENLREIMKQQEIQLSKMSQLSNAEVQKQTNLVENLREIIAHQEEKLKEYTKHTDHETVDLKRTVISLREIIKHQEQQISALAHRESEIVTPMKAHHKIANSYLDALREKTESEIKTHLSHQSESIDLSYRGSKQQQGLSTDQKSSNATSFLNRLRENDESFYNHNISITKQTGIQEDKSTIFEVTVENNNQIGAKDLLVKENRQLKEQLEMLKTSIKNQQEALDRYRLSAGDMNVLDSEEVSRLENELKKTNHEKEMLFSKYQKIEVKFELLRQKVVQMQEKRHLRTSIESRQQYDYSNYDVDSDNVSLQEELLRTASNSPSSRRPRRDDDRQKNMTDDRTIEMYK